MNFNFITGNKFREHSHYTFDQYGYKQNKSIINSIPIFFVATHLIDIFFSDLDIFPKQEFILITHNSDHCIDSRHLPYIEHKYVIKWFAQNVNFAHPKLIPIPIGIANNEWPHGKINDIIDVINLKLPKTNLMYANFRTTTNSIVRNKCLNYISPEYIEPMIGKISFKNYLSNLSKAYFSICPFGNGIDSHRIWESLYLKTIPIAETTYNISKLIDMYNLPIILIDDWSHLKSITLNTDIYQKLIDQFDPSLLNTELFLQCSI